MPIASSCYWNDVHGYCADDVYKDEEGVHTMQTLGNNMAFLIKSINLGKTQFGLPQNDPKRLTNFIR
jgi:hypothetical protein